MALRDQIQKQNSHKALCFVLHASNMHGFYKTSTTMALLDQIQKHHSHRAFCFVLHASNMHKAVGLEALPYNREIHHAHRNVELHRKRMYSPSTFETKQTFRCGFCYRWDADMHKSLVYYAAMKDPASEMLQLQSLNVGVRS